MANTIEKDGVLYLLVPVSELNAGDIFYKKPGISSKPFVINHHNTAKQCKKEGYRADGFGEASISPDDNMNKESFLRHDKTVFCELY